MKIIPKAKTSNLIIKNLENETLIYDLSTSNAFCLNETSSIIWRCCDGTRTITEVSNDISKQMNKFVSEDLIWFALDQFRKDDLLEKYDSQNNRFQGLSRREIIQKVGFTSVIALPLISSIVAPKAAMAQSGGNLLATCPPATCSPGLTCSPTNNVSGGTTFVPTGINQCCTPGANHFTPNAIFCDAFCPGSNCCSGSASFAPPVSVCTNLGSGFPTCICN